MKINIKLKESITIEDGVTIIKNIEQNSDYYIITKNNLKILKSGQVFRARCNDCEFITDKIDDIILYHSDALKAFQDSQKPQPIEPQIGE